jgi:O-antigen/teichoic acid export membrane protein
LVGVAWFYLGVFRGIAQGLEAYRLYGTSLVVENVARLAVTGLAVRPWGVWGGLAGLAAGATAAAVWASVAMPRPRERSRRIPWASLGWTALGVGLTALTPRLDLLVVKHAWPAVQAGAWGALSLFGQGFSQLPWLASTVMFPRVVRDAGRRAAYFRISAGFSAGVLGLAACLGWFFVPRFASFFFANRYRRWQFLFGPYLFAVIPVALYALWISYAVAQDRRHLLLLLAGGVAVYLIALLLHHATMADVLWDYLALAVAEAAMLVVDRPGAPSSPHAQGHGHPSA